MIELSNVRGKVYQRGSSVVEALRGVTFTVPDGEFVSIMGPSGSGKSTLLNVLGALDVPSTGSIRIEGKELETLGDRQLSAFRRDRIGFVFQFFNLLPTLSALENVMLPRPPGRPFDPGGPATRCRASGAGGPWATNGAPARRDVGGRM